MYIVNLINLKTKAHFSKPFYTHREFKAFLVKCKYSDEVAVTGYFKPL